MTCIRAANVRAAFIALLSAGSVVIGACGGDDVHEFVPQDIARGPQTPIRIPPEEPIVIGVSTALTGPIAERGNEYLDAVVVGVERWKSDHGELIGGHEIEIVGEDDGCAEPGVAIVAARRLLGREGLVGVVGPQCSSGAATAVPAYSQAGIVSISGSATATVLTEGQQEDGFFFRTAYRNDLEGAFVALFLSEDIEAESIYLIDDGELFGEDLADTAQRLIVRRGIRVVRESINQGDVDFSDLAARIAADDPDFVAFAGFNPEAALLLRQIRDAGYGGPFGASDGAASQGDFVEPLGEVAEGALFSGCGFPLPDDLVDEFDDLHGYEPQASFPAQYVDAVTAMLDAVVTVAEEQNDGSLMIDPQELRDAVRATDMDGISGPIAFDSRGDRVPEPGYELEEVQEEAFRSGDGRLLVDLGLVQCQVQDGQLIVISGSDTPDIRM
jgi:branched-chain amino acid transport system substrate-binding protein